jgi:hypothetical protein
LLADSNAEVAKELFLSEATIKTHVAQLLQKLDLRDRVQAAVLANYDAPLVEALREQLAAIGVRVSVLPILQTDSDKPRKLAAEFARADLAVVGNNASQTEDASTFSAGCPTCRLLRVPASTRSTTRPSRLGQTRPPPSRQGSSEARSTSALPTWRCRRSFRSGSGALIQKANQVPCDQRAIKRTDQTNGLARWSHTHRVVQRRR